MMKALLFLVVGIFVFVGGFMGFRRFETGMIFHPLSEVYATPESIGLPYEDIYVTTSDAIRIHGWLIKAPEAISTLLFFHGNAGNLSDRLDKLIVFYRMGMNVLIIDYRGYGRSEGNPTEKGLNVDALAAYAYLENRSDIANDNIVVYGESLGSAVAVELAMHKEIKALIMAAAFTSIKEMAHLTAPWVPAFLINTKMDSLNKIHRIQAPKLFIHSPEDDIVPYSMGQHLYKAAQSPKEFLVTRGGHNDGFAKSKKEFAEGIRDFLRHHKLLKD